LKIKNIAGQSDRLVKIFSYDETRLGLITCLGKKITLKGVRPVSKIQRIFENYYIYGAVGIPDGENFFLEFPVMNTYCFQFFIDCLSREFPDSMNLLLTDNAGIHKAKRLIIPENIYLIFLPAYSPELNPVERFWQHVKKDIKNRIFNGLQEMKDYVANFLKHCSDQTVASLTNFSYISDAFNSIFQN